MVENTSFNSTTVFYKRIKDDTIQYILYKTNEPTQFFYTKNDTVVEYIIHFFYEDKIFIYGEKLPNIIFTKELIKLKKDSLCTTYKESPTKFNIFNPPSLLCSININNINNTPSTINNNNIKDNNNNKTKVIKKNKKNSKRKYKSKIIKL